MQEMIPLRKLEPAAGKIQFLFTDVDDTLTHRGRLFPETYQALWHLSEYGIKIVPVTGGPGGWAHMIIRQWPVDAIISESGAFAFYREDEQIKTMLHPSVEGRSEEIRTKIGALQRKVAEEVPGVRVSQDQFARMYDLAFDVNETEPKLESPQIERIMDICRQFGARTQMSSIHVNAWFGEYNKIETSKLYLSRRYGLTEAHMRAHTLYCGDALNDEPMFEFFDLSCGVANVIDVQDRLNALPKYVTEGRGGLGFAELADVLIKLRTSKR